MSLARDSPYTKIRTSVTLLSRLSQCLLVYLQLSNLGAWHALTKTTRVCVAQGDIVVWGGTSRLRYHGILPLKSGLHPLLGSFRFNLTFLKAS